MKRIEFIAPVEAMRGNLSGNQELQYKTADGKVYSAAEFESLMADYKTRYVGAKRRQYGNKVLNIFSVKTKTTSTVTPKSKKAMAVFGGAAEVYRVAFKTLSILSNLQAAFMEARAAGFEGSLRQWAFPIISKALDAKDAVIVLAGTQTTVRVNNPWVDGGSGTSIEISSSILVKFWGELANNPVTLRIGAQTCPAHSTETFSSVITGNHNVLGLEADGDFVKFGDEWLLWSPEDYVGPGDLVSINSEYTYTLTNVQPV